MGRSWERNRFDRSLAFKSVDLKIGVEGKDLGQGAFLGHRDQGGVGQNWSRALITPTIAQPSNERRSG